jgi:hypothetical protein
MIYRALLSGYIMLVSSRHMFLWVIGSLSTDYIPEDSTLHIHHSDKLISYKSLEEYIHK